MTTDAAAALVRARGLRASAARRLVLQALLSTDRPVTAEEVAGGLGGRVPVSDLGSVYRNLATLERAGLVRELRAAHGAALYTLARTSESGYLTCERCGEVRAADRQAMAAVRAAVRAVGYEASLARFPIVGVCDACRT